ncbi:MAG: anthranilate synthase component 1 [Acidimicrobiales bacterium]|jgi:anthranilate synthase component 1
MSSGPSREQFRQWAKTYTVLPIWRELVADLTTPVAAFARLVRDEPGFILESVENGERWSRFSFVGRRPRATLIAHGLTVQIDGDLGIDVPTDQGILATIEALLQVYRSPVVDELPPMHGGLVGYLGYDVVREIEKLPDVPNDQLGLPDASLMIVGQIAAFDHWRQRVALIENVVVDASMTADELDAIYDQALLRLDDFAADGASGLDEPLLTPPNSDDPLPQVRSTMSGGDFQRAVGAAKELISAGDIFQVVLSQRFDFELDADPFDVYRVLRQINPSPYMYFVRTPEVSLAGASPEPLVRIESGRVISRPIAGTRRRGKTDAEDRALGAELAEDPKERAEHVMLVDLARNDIGRVIEYGSMQIDELMVLEHYSHVMHLTSQVSGELRDGLSPVDVIRATLPAGTLSGAPKVRAMEIIDDFEPSKRGPYGGVVGYIDFNGNLDTAICIRTMIITADGASVQAGAGVVYDSDPELEHNECYHKASALLAAVPAAERLTAARRAQNNAHDQSQGTASS